jgi:hypothetical protein
MLLPPPAGIPQPLLPGPRRSKGRPRLGLNRLLPVLGLRRRPLRMLQRSRQRCHPLKLNHPQAHLVEEQGDDPVAVVEGEAIITVLALEEDTIKDTEEEEEATVRGAEIRPEGGTCTIRRDGLVDISTIINRSRSRSTRRQDCRTGTFRRTCRGRRRSWRSSTRGSWW